MSKLIAVALFLFLGCTIMHSNDVHKKLVAEYPTEFCSLLEEHYGSGMMSEGGDQGIDLMFQGIDLKNKKALDVGSGLGGVAQYLVEKHTMDITGLEINPLMIQDATKRIPQSLQSQLRYLLSTSDDKLNFPDNHFDVVYSKEVFIHLKDKLALFKELKRVLKPDGTLIIADWVAPKEGLWSKPLQSMIDIDGLTLIAQTQKNYKSILEQAGFKMISVKDDSKFYAQWTHQVYIDMVGLKKEKLIKLLGEKDYQSEIEGYKSIADAFINQDLYLITFIAE